MEIGWKTSWDKPKFDKSPYNQMKDFTRHCWAENHHFLRQITGSSDWNKDFSDVLIDDVGTLSIDKYCGLCSRKKDYD